MPVCLAMGEAAGMAAAHAVVANGADVHAVDTVHLRRRLREEGAYLPAFQPDSQPPIEKNGHETEAPLTVAGVPGNFSESR
jgi:hypothetical protein